MAGWCIRNGGGRDFRYLERFRTSSAIAVP